MRNMRSSSSRRELLAGVLAGALALTLLVRVSRAAGTEVRLDPNDASAAALGYRPDGATSERPSADQACGGCAHFTASADPRWGRCAILSGGLVSAGGWCRAYTRRGG